MARLVLRRLTMLSLVTTFTLFAAVASARAQLSSPIRMKIPFDFTVGNKTLPAGEYTVGRVKGFFDTSTLSISSVNTSAGAVFLTHHAEVALPKNLTTLVFHKYGDRYFLAQIWSSDERDGNELAESGNERSLRRQLAAQPVTGKMSRKAPEPVTVTVVASSR